MPTLSVATTLGEVKSATKKRLMELGVSEEFAHKLATDRNMTDIKSLSHDEIASTLGICADLASL